MTTLNELQIAVERMYRQHGYTTDLPTLGLGLCEEAGEVAGAINNANPLYVRRKGRSQDTLQHELKDLLVYVCAIANSAGISLDDCLPQHLAANARAEAAEAALAAVPVEALRRTWQRDIHDDPADADAIEQWLDARQQPEAQP